MTLALILCAIAFALNVADALRVVCLLAYGIVPAYSKHAEFLQRPPLAGAGAGSRLALTRISSAHATCALSGGNPS